MLPGPLDPVRRVDVVTGQDETWAVSAEEWVWVRDASWSSTVGHAGKLHFESPDDFAKSACGRSVLDNRPGAEGTGYPVSKAPLYMRCMRPGCRERWPK